MAKGDIETYFENGQWKNQPQGNTRASSTHDTKAETQAAGHQMAIDRDVEHVIKRQDGTIQAKNTYPRSREIAQRPPSRNAGMVPSRTSAYVLPTDNPSRTETSCTV